LKQHQKVGLAMARLQEINTSGQNVTRMVFAVAAEDRHWEPSAVTDLIFGAGEAGETGGMDRIYPRAQVLAFPVRSIQLPF